MTRTGYLFCEWTDLLFSSCFKPASMKIEGEKVRGIIAENRRGEYFFFAVFEDAALGEELEVRVWLEGSYTARHFIPEGEGRYLYRSNFAWVGPHLQRLSFPKGYEILSVRPAGEVGSYYSRPTVVWRRQGEFWGEIEVRLRRRR